MSRLCRGWEWKTSVGLAKWALGPREILVGANLAVGNAALRKYSIHFVHIHPLPVRGCAFEVILESMNDISTSASRFCNILTLCVKYLGL